MQDRNDYKEGKIKIFSWMINSDRRVEQFDKPVNMTDDVYKDYVSTATAFKDFSIASRFPLVTESIEYVRNVKQLKLFALQAIEDSVLPKLTEYLESKGLKFIINKYTPAKMALNYVFAYDPNVHFDMSNKHRKLAGQKLCDLLKPPSTIRR